MDLSVLLLYSTISLEPRRLSINALEGLILLRRFASCQRIAAAVFAIAWFTVLHDCPILTCALSIMLNGNLHRSLLFYVVGIQQFGWQHVRLSQRP